MDSYKNIVLNVPHSSIANYNEGWTGKMSFFKLAKKNTDWHTDLIFSSRNPNVKMHKFPYSRFYVDVDKTLNDNTEMFGEGILYTDYFGFKRRLNSNDKEQLMGVYDKYMDELSADLDVDSLLITCESFSSTKDRRYDVAISINEDDGSKPSDDTLNEIAYLFHDNGYRVEFIKPSAVITPKHPIFYRSIRISVNKRTYLNENTLLMTDSFKRISTCINRCYGNLLRA